jgi:hypothetical protein
MTTNLEILIKKGLVFRAFFRIFMYNNMKQDYEFTISKV